MTRKIALLLFLYCTVSFHSLSQTLHPYTGLPTTYNTLKFSQDSLWELRAYNTVFPASIELDTALVLSNKDILQGITLSYPNKPEILFSYDTAFFEEYYTRKPFNLKVPYNISIDKSCFDTEYTGRGPGHPTGLANWFHPGDTVRSLIMNDCEFKNDFYLSGTQDTSLIYYMVISNSYFDRGFQIKNYKINFLHIVNTNGKNNNTRFHSETHLYSDNSLFGTVSFLDFDSLNTSHSYSLSSITANRLEINDGDVSEELIIGFSEINYVHFEHMDIKNRGTAPGKLQRVRFFQDTLNRQVNFTNVKATTLSFESTTFSKGFKFWNVEADTVIFNSCHIEGSNLNLNPISNNNWPVYLMIYDTDISKLDFDYTTNLRLCFPKDMTVSNDMVCVIYEKLLEKFKNEGKNLSYKNVDIEYTRAKYKERFFGPLFNFLQYWWWYYGYEKDRIILWTLGGILLFWGFNRWKWEQMRDTFDIEKEHPMGPYTGEGYKFLFKMKKTIDVLIYTLLIFFSFRIDFGKINYRRTTFVAIFLFQYFYGIICTAFLIRALFDAV